MSNTNYPRLTNQDIELWTELYLLTRSQQQFALHILPLLEETKHPLLETAKDIIALDTLLRKNHGKLLSHIEKLSEPYLKSLLLDLLRQ